MEKSIKSPAEQAEAMVEALLRHCPAIEITVVRLIGTDREQPIDRAHRIEAAADLGSLMGWLRAENSLRDGQVFVRPDPGQPHPWLLLDDLPILRALALVGKYAGLVVETSVGNAQVRLLSNRSLTSLTTEERTTVQRELARLIGADLGSVAGDKWGRLPGFTNRKPTKKGKWTNLLADTTAAGPRFDPFPYLNKTFLHPQGRQPLNKGGACPVPDGEDGSAREFAFACHRLRAGWTEDRVIEAIAVHALQRGKRSTQSQARQYAAYTVRKAQAALR